jgi:hypothetical protein
MNVDPSMAAPLASKNLGDLSKNNPAVRELFTAILKAVEHVGAHKVTGRKQGVSLLSFSTYRLCLLSLIFLLFPTYSVTFHYVNPDETYALYELRQWIQTHKKEQPLMKRQLLEGIVRQRWPSSEESLGFYGM